MLLYLANSQTLGRNSSVLSQDCLIEQLFPKEELLEMLQSDQEAITWLREQISKGETKQKPETLDLKQNQLGKQSRNSLISP